MVEHGAVDAIQLAGERRLERIDVIAPLIIGPIWAGLTIQALCSVIPLVILSGLLAWRTQGRTLTFWMSFSAVLMMVAVLAMRWNVVIGGQELSKTARGFLTFYPPLWGREGVVWALSLFASSFVWLWFLVRLLPPWERAETAEANPETSGVVDGVPAWEPARVSEEGA